MPFTSNSPQNNLPNGTQNGSTNGEQSSAQPGSGSSVSTRPLRLHEISFSQTMPRALSHGQVVVDSPMYFNSPLDDLSDLPFSVFDTIRVANLEAAIIQANQETETLTLAVKNLDGVKVGSLSFNLPNGSAGELFQELVTEKEVFPAADLGRFIRRAESLGARIESSAFGDEVSEILSRYEILAHSKVSARAKLYGEGAEPIVLDDKTIEGFKIGSKKDYNLIWLDITTSLDIRDMFQSQLEELIKERYKNLCDIISCDFDHPHRAFVETRVFSKNHEDYCRVVRDKLYLLIDSKLIVTVHDGDLDDVECLWEEPLRKKSPSPVDIAHNVLTQVYEQNEGVIRRLENAIDKQQDLATKFGYGTGRTQFLENLAQLERTARFIERKLTETLTSMHRMNAVYRNSDSAATQEWKKTHDDLRTQYAEIKDRAHGILEAVKAVRSTNSAVVAERANRTNERLTQIGAAFAPSGIMLTALEVFPQLMPYYPVLLGGSVALSSLLIWGLRRVSLLSKD